MSKKGPPGDHRARAREMLKYSVITEIDKIAKGNPYRLRGTAYIYQQRGLVTSILVRFVHIPPKAGHSARKIKLVIITQGFT